jgi:uncharacterized membrane protein YfcA
MVFKNIRNWVVPAVFGLLLFLDPKLSFAGESASVAETAWWVWVLSLFIFSFFLGIISVVAGVGGGVLFVPIVSGFFPFHIDFVRGVGLLVALAGALSAGPPLMKKGLADLKLGLPMALVGSVSSIAGAFVGLAMKADTVQLLLGLAIMAIAVIMIRSGKSGYPEVEKPDAISQMLGISGIYYEEYSKHVVSWKIHRTPLGLVLFLLIGFVGGMFGLGAGWANVPVFNLLMGVPLKVAVATSGLVLSINGAAATWIYMFKGAILPLIAVPSIAGMMLGSKIGAKLLTKVNTNSVRKVVIGMLVFAGIRSLLKGFGI